MNPIRIKTVKLISRLLQPLTEEAVLSVPEKNAIVQNLKYLAEHNTLAPAIQPRLVDRTEACQLLGLSLSNFKRIETANGFPFHRKQLAGAVRYRLTDIVEYINADDASSAGSATPDNDSFDGE